jgi:hypothetical protein
MATAAETSTATRSAMFEQHGDDGYMICERLFQLALPSFYAQIVSNGGSGSNNYTSLADLFAARATWHLHTQRTIESSREPCFLLLADLAVYFNACTALESNLVYLEWLFTLVRPLLFALLFLFVLPLTIVLTAFLISLFCFVMKHWHTLRSSSNWWDASLRSIAVFWEWHARVFFDHEIIGMDKYFFYFNSFLGSQNAKREA